MQATTSRLLAAVTALIVGAGCTIVRTSDGGAPPAPTTEGLQRTGPPPDAAAANQVAQQALKDVERYWAATYPTVAGGAPFQKVRGGYHPYTRAEPPPACGPERAEYQPNAFYCPADDFIAWDAETLIPELHADFGPLLVGVVIAHEYGHAIQSRLELTEQPTIVLEQQADCFAGGWVSDVLAGRATGFAAVTPEQLDSAVAGLLRLRDQPGTAAESPQAHGNAFDRVRAFQEGVEQNATRCAAYRAGNIPVTEVGFSTEREAASGGELPSYEDAVSVLSRDVEAYWDRTYPQLAAGQDWKPLPITAFDPADPPDCAGRVPPDDGSAETAFFCATGDYAAFDSRQLGPALYQRIGDNAVGMLLGGVFAQAAQTRRGQPTQGREGQLVVDCLAGSWTNDLLQRTAADAVRLSPGDLDEAVAALLVFNRSTESGQATAFDRIAAYRKGVLQGLSACA